MAQPQQRNETQAWLGAGYAIIYAKARHSTFFPGAATRASMRLERGILSGFNFAASPRKAVIVLALQALACACAIASLEGAALAATLACLLALAWHIWRVHLSGRHPREVCAAWPQRGHWVLCCRDGSCHQARLGAGCFIDARLAIIVFWPLDANPLRRWLGRRTLALFPDQLAEEDWHRLRLHCQVASQQGK